MPFAQSIPIKFLKTVHKEYNADHIARSDAYYYGDERFDANQELVIRDIEMGQSKGGQKFRQARLNAASYENMVGPGVDYIVSCATQAPPQILARAIAYTPTMPQVGAQGPQAPTPIPDSIQKQIQFYNDLNDNVGNRKSLSSLAVGRLLNAILHQRAYISIAFPPMPPELSGKLSKKDQRDLGYLNARLGEVDATHVLDWQEDTKGELELVKTLAKIETRSQEWMPIDKCTYVWTYWTKTGVYEYEATTDVIDGVEKEFEEKATASLVRESANPLGVVPLIPIKLPVQIIKRMLTIAKQLFNRTTSLEFSLDAQAFALMWVKSKKDFKDIPLAETAILHLEPDAAAGIGYAQPLGTNFIALAADCERLLKRLFQSFNGAGLNINSQDQNMSRLPFKARLLENGGLAVLLEAYGNALRMAIQEAVELIVKARDEQDVIQVEIHGLDKFDPQDLVKFVATMLQAVQLPLTPTAKNFALEQLSKSLAQDAPAEVVEQIDREAKAGQFIGPKTPNVDVEDDEKDDDNDDDDDDDDTPEDSQKEIKVTIAQQAVNKEGNNGPP